MRTDVLETEKNIVASFKGKLIEATVLMTFIKVADEIKLEIDIGLFEIE